MVKALFFLGQFWPRLTTVKVLFFLGHFWPRIPMVKVLVGLGHFWPRIPMVKLLLGHFWPRLPTVKVFVFHGHFWPRLLLSATSAMNTNDESYVCDLSNLWHPALPIRVRRRQSLAPHCASRRSRPGRHLLAWDWKYKYTRTPAGKRWHKSTSISGPGMERVNCKISKSERGLGTRLTPSNARPGG